MNNLIKYYIINLKIDLFNIIYYMDYTYSEKVNDHPHLFIIENDVTIITDNKKYTYLIGKKKHSNIVLIKRTNNQLSQETETINLDYAWYEIQKNIEDNNSNLEESESYKKAYIKYLLYHYNLGCTKYKTYKGYQKLVEFINPLITDYI